MIRLLISSVLLGLLLPGLAEAQDPGKKAIQDVLKEALDAAEQIPAPYEQSRALGRIAKTQAMAGFKEQAKKTFEKAFKVAESIGKDGAKRDFARKEMGFFVAEMMAEAGDISGALSAADKIDNGNYWFGFIGKIVGLYLDREEFDKTMEIATKHPDSNYVIVLIATKKAEKGKWKEAMEMVQSIKDERDKAELFMAFGRLQTKSGKKTAAAEWFQKASKIIDRLPKGRKESLGRKEVLQFAFASVLRDAGETSAALKILEGMPADSKYEISFREAGLVQFYCHAKQFSKALEHARKGREALGSETAFWHMARAQAEVGDFKGAQATLDEMKMPDFKVYSLMDISKVHFKNGNTDKAISSLREAMELTNKVPEAKINFTFTPGKANNYYKISLALTELGLADTARAWLARQISPHWQAWGYVGVAEGLLQKREKRKIKQ
jgi:tetratricopeptide (TPR) repeat protein